MNKPAKIIVGVVVLALVVWGIVANIRKQSAQTATGEPIKIAAVLALTGPGSFWAEFSKNAADMAAAEINSAGGVNGRPIQMLYEDSQTNPAQSVSAFKKAVEVDKADAVIGDVWAFITNPLIPLSATSKVVTISPTEMDMSVQGTSTYFFTLGHTMASVKGAMEKFFDSHASAKTVGMICWDADPWGLAFTKVYDQVIAERGLKVIARTCTRDFAADYRLEAAKMKAAKPDVIVIDGLGDRAVKALKNLGVSVPIVVDSNLVDGFENSNTIGVDQLKDVFVIDWRPNEDFSDRYKARYGRVPVLEAQNSYEAVRSIAKAIEIDSENLLTGLKQVKYTSVDGSIDFTSGDNITPNKAQAKLFRILGKGQYQEVN